MKKFYTRVVIIWMIVLPFCINAQVSTLGNSGIATDYVGWDNAQAFPLQIRHNGNQPINIFTNNTLRAQFTTGGALGSGTTQGDGLRFFDPSGGIGNLDLWTSASQQTHIRWDGSGIIQGRNNRFEMCGFINGLWFNVTYKPGIFNAQHPPAA